jgi:integrase
MRSLEYYAKGLFDEDGSWITFIRNKGYNVIEKTLKNKKSILDHYIIPFWGRLKPDEITIKKINSKLFTAKSIKSGKPLSFSTKNSILFQLSSILGYLIEEDILGNNIVHKVRKFNTSPQNPRGIILDFDLMRLFPVDHEGLLKIWRNQMFACAFLIMRDTGMRNNEILGLKWGDWYKELGVITILRAIEAGTKDRENKTKTGHPRVALVSDQASEELEIFRREKRALPNEYIFSRKDRKPVFEQRLTTAFHLAVKRAEINRPDYTPYWLRHTFASNLLDNYPFDMARRLMGHTNLDTTLGYRSRNLESLLKEAKFMKVIKGMGHEVSLLQMLMIQRQMEQVTQDKNPIKNLRIIKLDQL